jgi:hypothetical protein
LLLLSGPGEGGTIGYLVFGLHSRKPKDFKIKFTFGYGYGWLWPIIFVDI